MADQVTDAQLGVPTEQQLGDFSAPPSDQQATPPADQGTQPADTAPVQADAQPADAAPPTDAATSTPPAPDAAPTLDMSAPVDTALTTPDPNDIPAVSNPVAPQDIAPGDLNAIQSDSPPEIQSATASPQQLTSAVAQATAEAHASSSVTINLEQAPATAGLPVVDHPKEAVDVARQEHVSVDDLFNYTKLHGIDFHDYRDFQHKEYDQLIDHQQDALDKLCNLAGDAFHDAVDGVGKGFYAAMSEAKADIRALTKTMNAFGEVDQDIQKIMEPGGNHHQEQRELWHDFKDLVRVEHNDLSLAAGQDHGDFQGLYQDFVQVNHIIVNDFLIG